MALGPQLALRQSQSLVMTPQMQQAVKLLALSNLELETFIEQSLHANPLLEIGDTSREAGDGADSTGVVTPAPEEPSCDGGGDGDSALDLDPQAISDEAKIRGDNGDWSDAAVGPSSDDHTVRTEPDPDAPTLAQHLTDQLAAAAHDAREAFVAARIIGELDDSGYLSVPLEDIANELDIPANEAERALALVQSLDPTGVGARSLAECIALQAKEADRYDPCMARLIDNLDLVARGEVARLKRLCEVDDEDFADMLAELRRYDPKPGCRYGGCEDNAVVPDILMHRTANGWDVRLNEATLPRLVVNREYYLSLRDGCQDKAARGWLDEQLGEAHWLLRALDQRQKTILKAAAAIIEHQAEFFRRGVAGMRSLTLREVAARIGMHESTVSRVTSNKYLACPFGTFELRYFFSSGIADADGEGDASSQAVKARIRALIDAEQPDAILSDDKLVDLLKAEGLDLARRTVAKYREAMGLGSSVERRRRKKLQNF
jgi:RNA polymerase sigma-54 factor